MYPVLANDDHILTMTGISFVSSTLSCGFPYSVFITYIVSSPCDTPENRLIKILNK